MYRSRREHQAKVETAGGRASEFNWIQKSEATNQCQGCRGSPSHPAAHTGLQANVVEEPGQSVKRMKEYHKRCHVVEVTYLAKERQV